jgi:hypothetical protein
MRVATIIVLALTFVQPLIAQKVYSTRFAIHGGLSIPTGEFVKGGHTSTGFSGGVYVAMTNIRELSVVASAMYSSLPVDAPAQPNVETRVSNWKLVYVMLGLRGEQIVNEGNDKLYGCPGRCAVCNVSCRQLRLPDP